MSYGIVRVQKFKSGSVKGIEIHDRRNKDYSHTNKEIDRTKIDKNYDLNLTGGTFNQTIKKRISELNLKRAVRKDAVVMAQVLVTSDKKFFEGLSEDETKKFFEESYDFLKKRYGDKNVVSSVVHMDETTPHMHFNFVPVTKDGRLSAKAILNRIDLIKQQDDFFESVGQRWGLDRGEKGGYKKHLEVAEFKRKTALEQIKALDDIKYELDKVDLIEGDLGRLNKQKIKIDVEDFEKLKNIAKRQHVLESKIEKLERKNREMHDDIRKFNKSKREYFEKTSTLENDLQRYKTEYDYVVDFLKETNQVEQATDYVIEKRFDVRNSERQIEQDYELER